eukprot:2489178-Pleurochrysis_carterae.AAC.1
MRRDHAHLRQRVDVLASGEDAHVGEEAAAPSFPLAIEASREQVVLPPLHELHVFKLKRARVAIVVQLEEAARAAVREQVRVLSHRRRRMAVPHQKRQLRVRLVRRDDEANTHDT